MRNKLRIVSLLALMVFVLTACVSKKKKGEVGKFGKFYHNMTSKYNGYFNANELMKSAYVTLEAGHIDNYNKLLPVFPYVESTAAKTVAPDMEIVMEKVTKVAIVHEPGDYVDDCYVMMGQAQFLKQDYETAEETFVYFQEEFNPNNPFGKNYKKKKKSKKQREKEREAEKKKRDKEREEAQKLKREEREAADKAKEEERKKREEERKKREEQRKKEREEKKKERERKKKNRNKKRKKGSKKRPKKEETKVEVETPVVKDSVETVVPEIPEAPVAPKEVAKVEEEKESKKDKEKDEPKDETAYSEGLLWLAKTYIERENYNSADYILKGLEKKNVQDHVKRQIAPTLAHLKIRQQQYMAAIPYLTEAIETADKKENKARYAYIIGQIYQQSGLREEASRAFERVNKYKPSFDMRFNAKLAAMKNAVKNGSRPIASVEDELNDMLGERKYNEYEHQIHYTLGDIHLSQGRKKEAIGDFSRSLRANANDTGLKAETYYLLADLYYKEEAYVEAKNYYDSTLMVMVKEDLRYPEVDLLAKNLSEIALKINTITLQDSLLRLAKLSDEELREVAKEIIRNQPKEEMAEDEDGDKKEDLKQKALGRLTARDMFGTSDKWPYDLQKVEKGKQDFRSTWGDIALEDNWRRSTSNNAFYTGNDDELAEAEEEVEEEKISDREINNLLKAVPKTPNDVAASEQAIMNSMFDLGVLYRSKLNNYPKSIETLEALIKRFPDTPNKLDAYYNLYLANLDINDQKRANYYLGKITSEFAESTIAKILTDPDYGKKVLSDEQRILAYYEDTYQLFNKGRYAEVNERIKSVDLTFTFKHTLKPKFALLNAMSLGKINGKEAYIASLTDMVTRYADTPEATRGKEILRFLKGDGEAFSQLDIKEVDNIFRKEDDRRHYLMVLTYVEEFEKFMKAKEGISRYNKKYHKLKKLQLNHSTLDQENNARLILVRQFKNKEQAVKYYEEIAKNKEEFVANGIDYEIFAITQANYRRVVAERSVKKYRVFHDTYYTSK